MWLLFLVTIFCASLSLVFYFTLKDYKKNFSNFDKLAELLNVKAKSSLFYDKNIEGWYRDRWVDCKVSFARGFGTSMPDFKDKQADQSKRFNSCPMYLSIQTAVGKKEKYRSFLLSILTPKRLITDYTCLFVDGRVFYTNCKVSDKGKGYRTFSPQLSTAEDKKSLWAFFAMELSKEDIKFFLDELIKASELVKKT
jgi:hypothetical protein